MKCVHLKLKYASPLNKRKNKTYVNYHIESVLYKHTVFETGFIYYWEFEIKNLEDFDYELFHIYATPMLYMRLTTFQFVQKFIKKEILYDYKNKKILFKHNKENLIINFTLQGWNKFINFIIDKIKEIKKTKKNILEQAEAISACTM